MRVVADTNIFVSAALKQASWPAQVIRWLDRFGGLLKTAETEAQALAVLQRPQFASRISPEYMQNVRRLFAAAEPVPVVEHIRVCRDPTDDRFLELAVNGRADVIVTGDRDLLVLDPFRGIPIVAPMTFLRAVSPHP